MNTTDAEQMDDEQALLQRIASLPREIQPGKDLWPGIALRIDPASGTSRPAARRFPAWPAAIAASLFVAFTAAMLVSRPWETNSQTNSAGLEPVDLPAVQGVAEPEPAIFTQRSASESEYLAAFREFLAIHPAPGPGTGMGGALAPEWIAQTQGVLQQTEVELTAALSQSPDDPLLQQRMAALRAYQLEWLKRMAAAERISRRMST